MTGPLPNSGDVSLLLLADMLDHADKDHATARQPPYDQTRFAHRCGSPGCAIGHWLAYEGRRSSVPTTDDVTQRLPALFNVDNEQWSHLFGYAPGYPKNAAEAAARIRAFVAARSALTVRAEHE